MFKLCTVVQCPALTFVILSYFSKDEISIYLFYMSSCGRAPGIVLTIRDEFINRFHDIPPPDSTTKMCAIITHQKPQL